MAQAPKLTGGRAPASAPQRSSARLAEERTRSRAQQPGGAPGPSAGALASPPPPASGGEAPGAVASPGTSRDELGQPQSAHSSATAGSGRRIVGEGRSTSEGSLC